MNFRRILYALLPLCLLLGGFAHAKAPQQDKGGVARYIVVLDRAPLAEVFARGGLQADAVLQSRSGKSRGRPAAGRLDVRAESARVYLTKLDQDFANVKAAAAQNLGREIEAGHRYRHALHGFTTVLSAAEAERLAKMPGVRRVERDSVQKLETDSGPQWIGATGIWNGVDQLPATRGEGVVVGVIDSGINWEHDSFQDPGEGTGSTATPFDHQNPFGVQLGLCSKPSVQCNDKLVGVYDFVADDPSTGDVVEEITDGFDNDGHGSHVASIAVGNSLNVSVFSANTPIAGVAPNANLVTYRVCFIGDPDDPDDDGCQNSAILDAIDQAIEDGVDVINYSIGTDPFSPWFSSTTPLAFLNAVGAGIFVVTSAGNTGPAAGSIGSPANAPWVVGVGNASHNRIFGNQLLSLSGGNTTPPHGMRGASLEGGSGIRPIVYAGDYGNALCGTGEPELQPSCASNTGATNPFAPGTFNGEIVVCDRGTYGRIEKGKNLQLAGAGGYILANTGEWGNSISADEHCLPATHVTAEDGDRMRNWLASGSDHSGAISIVKAQIIDAVADQVAATSSRGPAAPPVENMLKPNLIAPGTDILGAFKKDEQGANNYVFMGGTSMSSPTIAGSAALLLAGDDSLTPSMVASMLETTATTEQAVDHENMAVTPFVAGAGRPRLTQAANAGLYLDESLGDFQAANPSLGGDPRELNLAGLVSSECKNRCSFTRTVTSRTTSRSWTAAPSGFPEGVNVTVTPSEFTLANGASQSLEIEIDHGGSPELVGQWIYGSVVLAANDMPEQKLTTAVFASGGELPLEWPIASEANSGWKNFFLANLTALPDLTLQTGGLVEPSRDIRTLPEDPTDDNPFDGGSGVFTVWKQVAADTLWLHAETLQSSARDLDLYVGLDSNGDGVAQENELLCESSSPDDVEFCEIFTPEAGSYWVLVQNWWAGDTGSDQATLLTAVVGKNGELGLTATSQGAVLNNQTFPVRVAWNNVDAVPGTELLGAVGIGTDRDHPNNVGVIPVRFSRLGIEAPRTLPLMNGKTHRLALAAGSTHDRIFIDVPPGATDLLVSASGDSASQSNALSLELRRMGFGQAFGEAPIARSAPQIAPVASDSGSGGEGPVVIVQGAQLQPGRWYAVLKNNGAEPVSAAIVADVTFSGETVPMHGGLWKPQSRSGLNQGYEYSDGGPSRAFIWYTYDEAHDPTWYLAATEPQGGNIWVADLLRFTNDGDRQQEVKVGHVAITMLAKEDQIFTWSLFGQSGSDRMQITAENSCQTISNQLRSLTGLWYRGVAGLGGASVLYNEYARFQIHYLYDSMGYPRWLAAADPSGDELTLLQFHGDCPVCEATSSDSVPVGILTQQFQSNTAGQWTLDFVFDQPLTGSVIRTDDIVKITDTLACP